MDASKEVSGGFLVACCDAPEVFDEIEEALDEIAFGVEREVAMALNLAVRFWRNDHRDAAPFETSDEAVAVIALVGKESPWRDIRRQRFGLSDVVDLAFCQGGFQRVAEGVDDDVDFRRQSAARTADGLIFAPFLSAPALC